MPEFFGESTQPSFTDDKRTEERLIARSNPLNLDIPDNELIFNINQKIDASQKFYDKKEIPARRKRNREYLFGNQLRTDQLKYYNAQYVDNIIYEAEGTIKPISLSRLPDLLAKAGDEADPDKQTTGRKMTKLINNDIRKRENRQVLGLAFRHHPAYFIGAVKAVWDPKMGRKGNYRFKVVHPENLVLDHRCATNNPEDMEYIAESVEMSVKEACMMFPKKEKELLTKLGIEKGQRGYQKQMASPVKLWEVWFQWPKETEDPETGEKKYEMTNGVIWKYKDVLLGKMKNPYWDWEGERRLFVAEAGKKREPTEDEVLSMFTGIESERFFNNYFEEPRFPYMFMGYDQWGEMPLDETSRIEQVISLQDNVNKRGRQITEMNDRAKGKHVFSTDGGIEKETVEEMDMNNPDEDIVIDGSVREFHAFIPGQPAPAQLYKEQEQERQKAFAKMKTHSTTRGEKTTDVATTNQILRESDYSGIDDLTEETINSVAERMAGWAMQFIKLFYTTEHTVKLLGKDGTVALEKVSRDDVTDGMDVIVSASGVDKMQSKREAYERARMKLTDPLSFFEDAGVSDPIGRTEKLMTFMMYPELYHQQFVKGRDTQGMVDALQQQPIGNGQATPEAAATVAPQGGGTPTDTWLAGYGGGSPTFHKESM